MPTTTYDLKIQEKKIQKSYYEIIRNFSKKNKKLSKSMHTNLDQIKENELLENTN